MDEGKCFVLNRPCQPIHLIGVEFNRNSRSVVGFEPRTLPG